VSYSTGDLVKFIPKQGTWEHDDPLIGMVGMILSSSLWYDDEYLSVIWADGMTLDAHVDDLEPVDWHPCVNPGT